MSIKKALSGSFGILIAAILFAGIMQLGAIVKVKKDNAAVHLLYGSVASLGIDVKNSVGIASIELQEFFAFDKRADWDRGKEAMQTAIDQTGQLLGLLEHLPAQRGHSIIRIVSAIDRDLEELSRLSRTGHTQALDTDSARQRLFDFITRPGHHSLRQLDVFLDTRHGADPELPIPLKYYDMLNAISSSVTKLQAEVFLALVRYDLALLSGHDSSYFDVLRQISMLERDPDVPHGLLPENLRREVEQLRTLDVEFYLSWKELFLLSEKCQALTRNILKNASELVESTELLRDRALSENQKDFKDIENMLIALLALLVIAGVVLAAIMYRRLARPLEKMAVYMHDVANEKQSTPPEKSGTAEIDELVALVAEVVSKKEQQLGEALASRQEAMRASVEARSDASAKASILSYMEKEIRAPLSGITGVTALCLQTEMTPRQREYLLKIQHATQSLVETVEILFDVQKLEAQQASLVCKPFAVSRLMESVRESFTPEVVDKGLILTCSIEPDVPQSLTGDVKRLKQLLDTIIDNAIKHTDEGEIEVSFSLAHDSETYGLAPSPGEVALCMRVRDTGIGLPGVLLQRLAKNRPETGQLPVRLEAGPGIAIVSHIARLMRGKLWAESAPGRGTEFFVTVLCPLSPAAGEAAATEKTDAREAWGRLDLKGYKILLVEDNGTHTEITKELLELYGLEVVTVSSGIEAIEKVRQTPFDLVLMDIQMPGMDGFTASSTIRELAQPWIAGMPIVAVSAHLESTEEEPYILAGMQDFIPKPVNIERLHYMLERWLLGAEPSPLATKPIPEGTMSTLDVSLGLHHLNGNEQLYDKLLRRFAESNKNVCDEIRASLDANDSETAIRLAHTLKGVSASLGAPNLSAEAFTIEQMLKAGNYSAEALIPLEAELGKVIEAIEARLG